MKTVFLGDFNVDIIMDGLHDTPRPDREIGCDSFSMAMGASTCITAAAYARLGGSAWVSGLVGEDRFSAFMVERLAEAGVRTEGLCRDRTATTGVTVNLVEGNQRYQITYPGAMGIFCGRHVTDSLFDGIGHLHLSGVYQAKALFPDIASLLARAHRAGATTSLDCQWDPTERWDGLAAWLPLTDWLFTNEQEALSMTGRSSVADALRSLAVRTSCPVVKCGASGARLFIDGTDTHLAGRAVPVVDTIGAGDNFNAGFLFAHLVRRQPLLTAATFANAAAGRSCMFRGGTDARSSFDDIMHLMDTENPQ